MTGTDLTRIDSIDVMTGATVISEAGYDMSKWKTENHFVSWLRLCPDNRISGNKVIGKGRLPTNNPVSIALKMAATSLRQSKTYLGAQFRRLRTKLGAPIAIKAMAAKLARMVYRMLRYGMEYVDKGAAFYELKHRELQDHFLKCIIAYSLCPVRQLGFEQQRRTDLSVRPVPLAEHHRFLLQRSRHERGLSLVRMTEAGG